MEGYVNRRSTSLFKRWNRRYLVLKSGILCYYDNMSSMINNGSHTKIKLEGSVAKIVPPNRFGRPFCWSIITIDSKGKLDQEFVFQSDTVEQRHSWLLWMRASGVDTSSCGLDDAPGALDSPRRKKASDSPEPVQSRPSKVYMDDDDSSEQLGVQLPVDALAKYKVLQRTWKYPPSRISAQQFLFLTEDELEEDLQELANKGTDKWALTEFRHVHATLKTAYNNASVTTISSIKEPSQSPAKKKKVRKKKKKIRKVKSARGFSSSSIRSSNDDLPSIDEDSSVSSLSPPKKDRRSRRKKKQPSTARLSNHSVSESEESLNVDNVNTRRRLAMDSISLSYEDMKDASTPKQQSRKLSNTVDSRPLTNAQSLSSISESSEANNNSSTPPQQYESPSKSRIRRKRSKSRGKVSMKRYQQSRTLPMQQANKKKSRAKPKIYHTRQRSRSIHALSREEFDKTSKRNARTHRRRASFSSIDMQNVQNSKNISSYDDMHAGRSSIVSRGYEVAKKSADEVLSKDDYMEMLQMLRNHEEKIISRRGTPLPTPNLTPRHEKDVFHIPRWNELHPEAKLDNDLPPTPRMVAGMNDVCQVMYTEAVELQNNRDFEGAIKRYSDAIVLSPGRPELYRGRSDCYLALDDLQKALADSVRSVHLQEAADILPLHPVRNSPGESPNHLEELHAVKQPKMSVHRKLSEQQPGLQKVDLDEFRYVRKGEKSMDVL